MYTFTATIDIIIGNPFVYVPEAILTAIFAKAGKSRGPIPVRGKLNGAAFTQTLVKYQGDWRLYINGIMLKAAEIPFKWGEIYKVVGEKVKIDVEFDPTSRSIPMHPDLAQALAKDKTAKAAFVQLAPYRKHEIMRYLGFLKTQTSIDRNIYRILQHLRGEKSDALYPLMHRKQPKKLK